MVASGSLSTKTEVSGQQLDSGRDPTQAASKGAISDPERDIADMRHMIQIMMNRIESISSELKTIKRQRTLSPVRCEAPVVISHLHDLDRESGSEGLRARLGATEQAGGPTQMAIPREQYGDCPVISERTAICHTPVFAAALANKLPGEALRLLIPPNNHLSSPLKEDRESVFDPFY